MRVEVLQNTGEVSWGNGGQRLGKRQRARAEHSDQSESGKKKEDGIDWVAVTQGGVGCVVDERKEKREECERNSVGIATEKEKNDAEKGGERKEGVKEKDGADEQGVRRKKVVPGRFGPEPGGGNAPQDEANFE